MKWRDRKVLKKDVDRLKKQKKNKKKALRKNGRTLLPANENATSGESRFK